jgi:hypothetical protein
MITCSMVYPPDVRKLAFQYCYVTFDGGRTWEPTLKVTEGRVNGDPTALYGRGDDVFVVALVIKDLDTPRDPDPEAPRDEARTVVYKSSDGGRTWGESTRFQFIDREFLLMDKTGGKHDGRMYIIGQGSVRGIGGQTDRRASSVQVFRSVDGGKTFNGPVHAAYPEGTIVNGVGTGAVLSDGTVVMMFGHTKRGRAQNLEIEPTVGPNAELHVITSSDGGEMRARREGSKLLADCEVLLVGRHHEARVRELFHLLLHALDDPRRGAAHRGHCDARAEVDEVVAVDIDQDSSRSALDVHRQTRADPCGDGRHLARLQRLGPRAGDGGDETTTLLDGYGHGISLRDSRKPEV